MTKIAAAVAIAAMMMIVLVPAMDSDAEMDVDFSGSGGSGVTVTEITSASQLPTQLQSLWNDNSIAVRFSLPSSNPYTEDQNDVFCDFRVSYTSNTATSATINAAAIDSNGTTRVSVNNMGYSIPVGSSTVYAMQQLGNGPYTAYSVFQYTNGSAYAIVDVADEGNYTCRISLVTYSAGYSNVQTIATGSFSTSKVLETITQEPDEDQADIAAGSTVTVDTSVDAYVDVEYTDETTGETVASVTVDTSVLNDPAGTNQVTYEVTTENTENLTEAQTESIASTAGTATQTFSFTASLGGSVTVGDATIAGAFTLRVALTGSLAGADRIGVFSVDADGTVDHNAADVTISGGFAIIQFFHFSDYVLYAVDSEYTVTASEGGSVSHMGTFQLGEGGTEVLTITIDDGYVLTDVIIDGVSQGAITTVTLTADGEDHTVHAQVVKQHTVTVTAGDNGSVEPSGETIVNDGESFTFTVTADEGYQVAEVLVNGQAVELTDGSYTIQSVNADTTVSVTFEAAGESGGDSGSNTLLYVVIVVVIIIVIVAAVFLMRRN